MSRSVSYLNNAEFVLYFPFEYDIMDNLKAEIKAKLPSYYSVDKWDNRETRIFLENNLCVIGISEYCGLCSLSVAIKDNTWNEKFAEHHASQIRPILEKIVDDVTGTRLSLIGTASNGEAFFERAKV
jgi:hypothetical protein